MRAAAEAAGSHTLFTSYSAGTVPGIATPFTDDDAMPLAHLAWVPTYNNDAIIDWLFDQSRGE